jgi:regulator of protease activity HflC (stomatin/prohibitin superfamily)
MQGTSHIGRTERPVFRLNGFAMLALAILVQLAAIGLIVLGVQMGTEDQPGAAFFWGLGVTVVFALLMPGFYAVQPNEARALVFAGSYIGSARQDGFFWSNPFAVKRRVSLRVRNFNSERLKVNDASGNPIEIAAVVTWKVVDSARALFDVDDCERFVNIQSETAIRTLATRFPYDAHEEGVLSLRGSPEEVARALRLELHERLQVAGVEILDARISHLAYAPEIAQAMLRRQQAQAIIAARQQIVEGAVGMVEMALRRLSEHQVIELDEERKAAMVSNLMVVLVSENQTQPIVNAGTLY